METNNFSADLGDIVYSKKLGGLLTVTYKNSKIFGLIRVQNKKNKKPCRETLRFPFDSERCLIIKPFCFVKDDFLKYEVINLSKIEGPVIIPPHETKKNGMVIVKIPHSEITLHVIQDIKEFQTPSNNFLSKKIYFHEKDLYTYVEFVTGQ